ncbi:unannotated protein [freshwater metagenome]|uniref:Unannotated protein n=1 Tax=freshwater metagenome TaxID=449393 RepID=A0A6J7CYZ6_9ZZZZ|nr:hypothetical protein [Actinomycetota bacterium]
MRQTVRMDLTGWDVVLWIHLLAMALFIGGQLFMGVAVVPVYLRDGGQEGAGHRWMQQIARRFGWASLGALAISLITGAAMASHLDLWSETAMNVKLGLVVIAIVLTLVHVFIVKRSNHLLQGLLLLDSLAIVLVATAL